MGRIRARWAALATALLVTLATCSMMGVAVAQGDGGDDGGGGEALEATEIGVTEDEIRISILADVENPLQPGLFKGSPDAMAGFEEFINDNGGLAGRDLVVNFID